MAGALVLPKLSSPSLPLCSPLAVRLRQREHVADGMWAEVVDAASRPGTEALERPPSSPRPVPR